MRARWLKPEFFRDRKIGTLGPVTALVYQALWCVADDGGTAKCDADQVKADMFLHWPAITSTDIERALGALEESARISQRYRVGDDTFCRIASFTKHQRIHKPSKFRHPQVGAALSGGSAALVPHGTGTPRLLESYTPSIPATHGEECGSSAAVVPVHYVTQCVVALNEGMRANPHVEFPREISTSSQLGKVTWEEEDIPLDIALVGIARMCAAFRPSGRDRQINSLRYCDAGVREAWHEAQMRSVATEAAPAVAGARNAADAAWLRAQGY